jgi:ACT domain-containing protein
MSLRMKMRKKLEKLINDEKRSLYDIALDLHVSESTMWKYRNGYAISDVMKQKIETGLKFLLDKDGKIH